jgi:hypothetical protein
MGCFDAEKSESVATQSAKRASQNELLDRLIKKFSTQIDAGPSIFPGETTAGLTDLQKTGIGAAGDIGGAFTTPTSSAGFGGGPLAGETTTAVSDLLTGQLGATPLSAEQFGDFFKASTSDPARKSFREETDPAIREAFAGPGFFSSARSKETVKQKTDLEDRLSSSLSAGQFANQTRNQQLAEAKAGRTQAAVGQAIQVGEAQTQTIRDNIAIAASQVQGLKELIGIGAVEQTQEQREIFAEIEKFAQEQQLVDPDDLAILMALLNINFSTSSSEKDASGAGLGFAGASGAFSSLAGAGAAGIIASDKEVKENIQVIEGSLAKIKQLAPFIYNYKDDKNKRRIGLIAQDVEKVLPEAVIDIDGVKHVDTYAINALIVGAINEMIGAK